METSILGPTLTAPIAESFVRSFLRQTVIASTAQQDPISSVGQYGRKLIRERKQK